MSPVIIGNATLYLGDCMDILPTLPMVDAVITDPPFGVGFKYASHDDKAEGYIEWLWPILEKAEAKCEPGSPMFVWQSGTNLRNLAAWFPREWRLFIAAKNFVQMRPTAMQWSYDPVVCWWAAGAKPWSAGTANRDFAIANTAPVMATPDNIERSHPCPRPLDLMSHVVGQWVKPAGVVLDLFMGSGTTGVACVPQGRDFVGIEKEPSYFDIACRRIEDAQRQAPLIPYEQPQQVQQELA